MDYKETIWVTGCKGFLGREIVKRLKATYNCTVVGTDKELMVTDPERIDAFAQDLRPDVVINCAGISRAVTGLSNRIHAYEVNALGARNVALAANNVGALMVQISTDDVFPVRMAEPANEFDTPHPETPYGKSKRAGEVMVRDTTPNHLIIRSSWVYSIDGGQVKDALDAAAAGKTLVARTDQLASPTSISTYVDFLIKAINRKATGVLHVTSRGMASRYELLSHVLNTCGYDANTILVPESDLVTAEQVELESLVLEMFGAELPTWQDDVESYFKEVGMAK